MENLIVVGAIVVLSAVTIFLGLRIVPQGREDVIERLGRYSRTLKPGLNFIIPYIESARSRVNVQEQVIDIPPQNVITKDNVAIDIDGAIFIQITNAAKSVYEVDQIGFAIQTLAQTNLRATVGQMELDEALANREALNVNILTGVQESVESWGAVVKRVEVADLSPPASVLDAMAVQLEADRRRRADILESEGKKRSAVLEAEGARESAILRAEGEKTAAILEAEGEAEARRRTAEAEKDALDLIASAAQNKEALGYLLGQSHVNAIANLSASNNAKTLVMPTDQSGLVSTLELIGNVTKQKG